MRPLYGKSLTPEQWREYFRIRYGQELRRFVVRLAAGWTEETAMPALASATHQLLIASIQTRKVTKNAHI